jgi:hypothetical protein
MIRWIQDNDCLLMIELDLNKRPQTPRSVVVPDKFQSSDAHEGISNIQWF